MTSFSSLNTNRVLVVIAPGSVIHTVKWVNGLAAKGYSVHLITQHSPTENISSKVKIHLLPFQNGLGYIFNAWSLNRLISKISPDIINVHYATGYGTLARLSQIKPYLLSVWGSDVYEFPYKNKINSYLLKGNLKAAKQIASTSLAMAEQVRSLLGQKIPIEITPFGVDMDKFSTSIKCFSNDSITIGIVKRMEHKYGIDILIEAFSQVVTHYKQVQKNKADRLKLLIVGSGSQRDNYIKLAKQLKVYEYCEFKEAVLNNEVTKLIEIIDVFVVSSRIESFGVAAIEASACSRPCVVSNVGGLPEVVKDNQTGFIVNSESILEFSNAIIKLIDNESLAQQFGDAGRQFVLESFSEAAVIDVMSNTLNKFENGSSI